MTPLPNQRIANMDGEAALPRSNGELVFAAPWEGRAFGIALALEVQGTYPWDDFRRELIRQIASDPSNVVPSDYYRQWLSALEKLAVAKGLFTREELDQRIREFLSGQREE